MRKTKEGDVVECQGVYGRLIVNLILKKRLAECAVDISASGQGPEPRLSEHVHETLNSFLVSLR
jgi:hypothetical protein